MKYFPGNKFTKIYNVQVQSQCENFGPNITMVIKYSNYTLVVFQINYSLNLLCKPVSCDLLLDSSSVKL